MKYPPDLARYVEQNWPGTLRVPDWALDEALATAFQASLTLEEARPTRFRLLLTPPEELPESGEPNTGVLRLLFDQHRPFEVEELRRLAPAVPFETALIGAAAKDGAMCIWGIAHSGPAWLAPSWGGRSTVANWTYDPIVHVNGPGNIAVRCAGKLVGALERGELASAQIDVFESSWLPALFKREREEVNALVKAEVVPPLAGKISQHMLRRTIQIVRGAHHGGMILVGDGGGLLPKYRVAQDEPSHRYRGALVKLLDGVAAVTGKSAISWADFVASKSGELEKLESAVFEWSRAVANLAAIDGAVLLDRRFGVVGFGVEVPGTQHPPTRVWRALDSEGKNRVPEDVQSRGTRHRAAYRFVNDSPAGLAIVVSHDGGVSFVAKQGDDVVVWEQSVGP